MAQVSENNGLSESADFQELDGLVKQVDMLKKKIRDLFMRAQETRPRNWKALKQTENLKVALIKYINFIDY